MLSRVGCCVWSRSWVLRQERGGGRPQWWLVWCSSASASASVSASSLSRLSFAAVAAGDDAAAASATCTLLKRESASNGRTISSRVGVDSVNQEVCKRRLHTFGRFKQQWPYCTSTVNGQIDYQNQLRIRTASTSSKINMHRSTETDNYSSDWEQMEAMRCAESIFQRLKRHDRNNSSNNNKQDYDRTTGTKPGDEAAPRTLSSSDRRLVRDSIARFSKSRWVEDQALGIYVKKELLKKSLGHFKKFLMRNVSAVPQFCEELMLDNKENQINQKDVYKRLFPLFACFILSEYPAQISEYRSLVQTADLRKPYENYQLARSMKRRIIYHAGPTNSGKTYTALQALKKAETGVYCAPLRLLAMGVADNLNQDGVYCNLITGQEKVELPGACHTSSTVEMLNLNAEIDVAVVDEIQMIGDESRGWAWTRAIHGLPAREVHVCGDPSAIQLLKSMVLTTNDDFEIIHYERFTPLTFSKDSLESRIDNVQPGDCVIAFSRKHIYDLKNAIERLCGDRFKCSVVYGALPPEARRRQANLFNASNNQYDVMVASDAIGMGLNLNIRRIIFSRLDKIGDAGVKQNVPSSMVKQIAGRAGRKGTKFPEGLVTTLHKKDTSRLIKGYNAPLEPTSSAGIFPNFEQVELFSGQLPTLNFPTLLLRFAETTRLDGQYFLCNLKVIVEIAEALEKVKGLSLSDRFNFATSPINRNEPKHMKMLLRWARQYAVGNPALPDDTHIEEQTTKDEEIPDEDIEEENEPEKTKPSVGRATSALQRWEDEHQLWSLYIWLSYRFGNDSFPWREELQRRCEILVEKITRELENGSNDQTELGEGNFTRKFVKKGKVEDRQVDFQAIHRKSSINYARTSIHSKKSKRKTKPKKVFV